MQENQNSATSQQTAQAAVSQTGNGTLVNITLPQESVERVASSIRQCGMMIGAAASVMLLMGFLFMRYSAQAELQTYQFNLLRSCLQSAQCDTEKALKSISKEK